MISRFISVVSLPLALSQCIEPNQVQIGEGGEEVSNLQEVTNLINFHQDNYSVQSI